MKVFLSGRIDGISLKDSSNWRQQAIKRLDAAGVSYYNPTKNMRVENYKPTPNEVFVNDRHNLYRSDIVLVNLELPETVKVQDAPFYTIGEMFLAHNLGKPIITFGSGFCGRPAYEAIVTKNFTNMQSAIDYIIDTYQ